MGSLRKVPNKSKGNFTPHELLYGVPPRYSLDYKFNGEIKQDSTSEGDSVECVEGSDREDNVVVSFPSRDARATPIQPRRFGLV